MKKLLIFLIFISTFSCSVDNSGPNSYFDILPIESAVLPNSFVYGETYEILMSYIRTSNCHVFNDVYLVSDSTNQHTIAIINEVFDNNNCQEVNEELETSFDFKILTREPIKFRFWQGTNENNIDEYLIIEVPVIN